jgi:hypothetical protein
VYAEEFLAKSLNAQPEAVSKRLEQDRAEAQEIFHKVRELTGCVLAGCVFVLMSVLFAECCTCCVFDVIKCCFAGCNRCS